MGLWREVRKRLPGSSRSLHAVHKDVKLIKRDISSQKKTIDKLSKQSARLKKALDQAQSQLDVTVGEIAQMRREIAEVKSILNDMQGMVDSSKRQTGFVRDRFEAHDEHIKMLLWQLYRRDDESTHDAKVRFFRNLPQAEGALRLLQLGNAQLLYEFDALCHRHGLNYWAGFGTLLGAVRHGGFIPWDDDVDLCMLRADSERLLQFVGEDSRFRITVVYDWYVHCKQIRFKFAEEDNPCFLDIFVFDCVRFDPQESFNRMKSSRLEMIDEMTRDDSLSFWGLRDPYVSSDRAESALIARHFDEAISRQFDGGYLTRSMGDAVGIIWGIENFDYLPWRCSVDDVFPVRRMSFEDGIEFDAPNNVDMFAGAMYGDIYSLPWDIKTHFQHVPDSKIASEEAQQAIRSVLHLDSLVRDDEGIRGDAVIE